MATETQQITISTEDLFDTIAAAMSGARDQVKQDLVKSLLFTGVVWRAERDALEWEPARYKTGDLLAWRRSPEGEPELTIVLGLEPRS
jgi:hypothetical protein